jgi:hypothetical protein
MELLRVLWQNWVIFRLLCNITSRPELSLLPILIYLCSDGHKEGYDMEGQGHL